MSFDTLVNGEISSQLAANDRGLQFGDGLFETIKFQQRGLVFWHDHYQRLQQGAGRLGIDCPDEQVLLNDIQQLLQQHEQGVIKIILSRGPGERGYAIEPGVVPTRIVRRSALPDYPQDVYKNGITTVICQHRLSTSRELCGIKHLNRLDNVLARAELPDHVREGIVCDQAGHVIEGTMSNLFVVQASQLKTPALAGSGVAGVVRERLLQLMSASNISCNITTLAIDDLHSADELFFCNSLIGVWPVARLDKTCFDKRPLSERMLQLLREEETNDALKL